MRARTVDRARYPRFLERAEEFLSAAQSSFARGHFQASTANAVHAAIAAMDAVTVFHLGRRSASERHDDAIDLVRTLGITDPTFAKRMAQFGRLLGLKTKAEYADAVVTRREAADAVQSAERIVAWARSHLPRM